MAPGPASSQSRRNVKHAGGPVSDMLSRMNSPAANKNSSRPPRNYGGGAQANVPSSGIPPGAHSSVSSPRGPSSPRGSSSPRGPSPPESCQERQGAIQQRRIPSPQQEVQGAARPNIVPPKPGSVSPDLYSARKTKQNRSSPLLRMQFGSPRRQAPHSEYERP